MHLPGLPTCPLLFVLVNQLVLLYLWSPNWEKSYILIYFNSECCKGISAVSCKVHWSPIYESTALIKQITPVPMF